MMRQKLILTALCLPLWLVSACNTTNHVPPQSLVVAESQPSDPLPNVELSPDVLFDVLLGEIAGRRGELDVTVEVLGRAAQRTRDPRLAERATLAALYIKHYQGALQSATLWSELQPSSREAGEAVANALLGLNRIDEAQVYFEKILIQAKQQGELDQAFLRIASILGQHTNRTAAFSLMQTLVNQHPDDADAHFALSHLAVRASEMEQADKAVDQALALRPEWEEAALFKVRILSSRKDTQAAQAFFEKYLRKYPRAAKVRLHYARLLVDLKQWESARKQFKQVVKHAPNDSDAILAVGLLALQVNRVEEAEKYLLRHLALRPESDQARLYLGQAAEQRKDYAQAARWYREITADNYFFEAQTRLGVMLAMSGDIVAARQQLRGINTTDERQLVQVVLAEEQILREAKQYNEALAVLTGALTTLPQHKDILYARALVAEKLDKVEMLEQDLRAILKQDPDNVHALNALGYTLADRTDRFQEAQVLLSRALEQKPEDPYILDSIGWLQYRMGNYNEALQYLRRALKMRDDAEISAHLGEVLWVVGERTKAKTVWRRALKNTPDNESLLSTIRKFDQ